MLAAGEDHAAHPEGDDVVSGHQHIRGIEVIQVLGLFRPAQGLKGPEGAAEPGVQHVGVTFDILGVAGLAFRGIVHTAGHMPAVGAVPHGDLVAPPELTGDAPVVKPLHPVEIGRAHV